MMLPRIMASRLRVWIARRMFDAANSLRRAAFSMLEAEKRRWGPVDK